MAVHGGKRKGAGRKKGAVTQATKEIKALAGQYSEHAIAVLVELMEDEDTPAATRRAAAADILDRAHGKPAQAITDPDGNKLMFPDKIEVVLVKAKG